MKSLQYLLDVEREKNKALQGKLQEINSLNMERFENLERENLEKITQLEQRVSKHKEKKASLKLQNSQMSE